VLIAAAAEDCAEMLAVSCPTNTDIAALADAFAIVVAARFVLVDKTAVDVADACAIAAAAIDVLRFADAELILTAVALNVVARTVIALLEVAAQLALANNNAGAVAFADTVPSA
jgi:hypothetical protein